MSRRWMKFTCMFLWICCAGLLSFDQQAAAQTQSLLSDRVGPAKDGSTTFYDTNAFGMPGTTPRIHAIHEAHPFGVKQSHLNALNNGALDNFPSSGDRASNFAGFLGLLGLVGLIGRLGFLSKESRP
jgi:hypothetical protein